MRIVITGGAGFIGANLTRLLVARGDEVTVIDDLSTGRLDNLSACRGFTFLEASILESTLLDDACADADAIVHLAAKASVAESLEDPVWSHTVNVEGTRNVLEAARRSARDPYVVLASSSAVYGDDPTPTKHEGLATRPLSPYAASKAANECYAAAYRESFGLDVIAFRFFNVFGPLQPAQHVYAAVIPAFVSRIVAGEPLVVHGDGKQTRDFTSVASLVAVLSDAVDRRVVPDGPVNLASGTTMNLLELIEHLEAICDRELEVTHVEPRAGDVRHSRADTTRLTELFPDVAAAPFEHALRETHDWFVAGCP